MFYIILVSYRTKRTDRTAGNPKPGKLTLVIRTTQWTVIAKRSHQVRTSELPRFSSRPPSAAILDRVNLYSELCSHGKVLRVRLKQRKALYLTKHRAGSFI